MDIIQKENRYVIMLSAGETIEIKINDNIAFSETVPGGFKADVNFKYNERV